MLKRLAKRSDFVLMKLVGLGKAESKIVLVEKKLGMPLKFKVPKPIIPIKFKRRIIK